jgi:hypothetical protein
MLCDLRGEGRRYMGIREAGKKGAKGTYPPASPDLTYTFSLFYLSRGFVIRVIKLCPGGGTA